MPNIYENILDGVKDPGPRPPEPGNEPPQQERGEHLKWQAAAKIMNEWLDAQRLFVLADGAKELRDSSLKGDPQYALLREVVVSLATVVVRRETSLPKDIFGMFGLTG